MITREKKQAVEVNTRKGHGTGKSMISSKRITASAKSTLIPLSGNCCSNISAIGSQVCFSAPAQGNSFGSPTFFAAIFTPR
jgi:hypothetical protein